jgi:hypothetical protein
MPAAQAPIFEILLIRHNQQLCIDLVPVLWADRPLSWLQQELFGNPETRNNHYLTVDTCHKFLPVADDLWTFIKFKDIEPTVSPPERALLASMIHRKISNDVQSRQGAICPSRLLKVTTTLRQKGRDNWQLLE